MGSMNKGIHILPRTGTDLLGLMNGWVKVTQSHGSRVLGIKKIKG